MELQRAGAVLLDAADRARLQEFMWPDGKLAPSVSGQSVAAIAARARIAAPQAHSAKALLVEESGFGPAHPFSGEKLSPVLAVYRARDFADALGVVERIYAYMGAGHSVGLHTARTERAVEAGLRLPVSRVIVNQAPSPAAPTTACLFAFDGLRHLGLQQLSDNLNYRHYQHRARVEDIGVVPTDDECSVSFACLGAAGQSMKAVRELVDAARAPDAVYLVAPESGRRISSGELADSCRAVQGWLELRGLAPGSHVSVVMGNGTQTVRLLLGAMYGGYCVNPINLLSHPEQMRFVLDHADASLVFVAPEWAERVRAMASSIARPLEIVIVDPDDDALIGAAVGNAAPAPDQPALLMYTSGTTGKPKECSD
jgi:hypothetical protein